MIAASLRWRLLLGAAAAILVALICAWLFMTLLFERHLERRAAAELEQDGLQLVAALTLDASGAPTLDKTPTDPRFETPASGRYWQISLAQTHLRSRSLWDEELPPSPAADAHDWRARVQAGPFDKPILLLERLVTPDSNGATALVQIAQDADSLEQARSEFASDLALFLGVLWIVLSLAAWLQVGLGLSPLAQVRSELARLQRSPSERLALAQLREVQPLIDAINALADAREDDLKRARARAGDLAHGLKTPLAALAAQSRRAREAGANEAADGLDRAIAAVAHTVDAELARARVAAARRTPGASSPALIVIEQIVSVLEHTERGGQLAFEINVPEDLALPVDRDDLTELLGPLMENAVRYARRLVRVFAARTSDAFFISIEDDGPGIDADQIAKAFARGMRLDESGGAAGLGLAIASDLAKASSASISMSRSALGGLSVSIRWAMQM